MVGDSILGKVVGADLLTPISGPHLAATVFGDALLLFLERDVIQSRAEDAQSLRPIFDLRLFVLARDHQVGGQMRDSDCGIGCVYRLAARSRRTKSIDAN